jgi:hypothetical protein
MVARNAVETVVARIVGSGGACVWPESGDSRFCVGAFGRNLFSVAVRMFSHLIYLINRFYKYYTFNAVYKDNSAINCITVEHRKDSFPSTFTGHNTLIITIFRHSAGQETPYFCGTK